MCEDKIDYTKILNEAQRDVLKKIQEDIKNYPNPHVGEVAKLGAYGTLTFADNSQVRRLESGSVIRAEGKPSLKVGMVNRADGIVEVSGDMSSYVVGDRILFAYPREPLKVPKDLT